MNEVPISFLSRMIGHCQIFVKGAIIRYELKRDFGHKKNKNEEFHEMRGNKFFDFGSMVGDIILFIKISINS